MDNIKLRINESPPLKCYLWQLHPLSVIFADHDEKYMPWLMNHYYNFDTISDYEWELIILEAEPWCYEGEEIFKLKDFSAITEACDKIIFFRLLRNMMRLGYYCATNINEKYIPGMSSYQKRNFYHSCLIFSLDENTEEVEILGYREDGFIGRLSVSYHDIYQAIEHDIYTPDNIYVRFFKLNEKYECECFKTDTFIHKVTEYLYGTNNKKGILCLKILVNSLYHFNIGKIDIRNIYIIYEHKLLMYKRLEFMFQQGLLSDGEILHEYAQVLNECNKLKMLSLKYNQTGSVGIPVRMADCLHQIVEAETGILIKVLKIL